MIRQLHEVSNNIPAYIDKLFVLETKEQKEAANMLDEILKKHNAVEAYKRNTCKGMFMNNFQIEFTSINIINISSCFNWGSTEEMYDFWNDLYQEFIEKIQHIPGKDEIKVRQKY